MAITCIVPGCDNKQKGYSPVMFHRIPTQHKRRKVWIASLHMDPNTPVEVLNNCRVCSEHFTEKDYTSSGLRLKHTATPTFLKPQQRRSPLTATAPNEETCPGITFDISEFSFDEEEEEDEEKEVEDRDSDWEEEVSDNLESHDSDESGEDSGEDLKPGEDLDPGESLDPGEDLEPGLNTKVRQLCPDCGALFFTSKTHTCEYKIKPLSCIVCGKRCVDENALKIHNRIHKESYEHPCKFCMVSFKNRLDKLAHEATHPRSSQPYQCPDCPRRFAKLPKRNEHLKGHRGPKIYSCPHCALQFRSEGNLERHVVVHTGERQFVCEFCSRSFTQHSHLKSHLRVHTGEKPFQCQRCDKSFTHNVSLKSHVMRYHNDGAPHSGPSGPRTKWGILKSMGRPRGRPKRKTATEEGNTTPAVPGLAPDPPTAADPGPAVPGPAPDPPTAADPGPAVPGPAPDPPTAADPGPAVPGPAPDPPTAADPLEEVRSRRPSSRDSDWSDRDATSQRTEVNETQGSEGVRKSKRKASQRPQRYRGAEKESEGVSDSPPEDEDAKKRKVFQSQEK